jgi:hypothetical protein
VVIIVADDDSALKAAERFMGGKVCIGEEKAEIIEAALIPKTNCLTWKSSMYHSVRMRAASI